MDNIEGLHIGDNMQEKKPIVFKCYDNIKKTYCPVVLGQIGRGMGIHLKFVFFRERYILDNHLNNNNWLKQHGLPMIRKGHPFYKECKSCKARDVSKIIFLDSKLDCMN